KRPVERDRAPVELLAAALGHADVGDDEVVAATPHALEARAPARRDLDAPAGLPEQSHDELAHARLVLDDEREPPRALDRRGRDGELRGRQLGRGGDRQPEGEDRRAWPALDHEPPAVLLHDAVRAGPTEPGPRANLPGRE